MPITLLQTNTADAVRIDSLTPPAAAKYLVVVLGGESPASGLTWNGVAVPLLKYAAAYASRIYGLSWPYVGGSANLISDIGGTYVNAIISAFWLDKLCEVSADGVFAYNNGGTVTMTGCKAEDFAAFGMTEYYGYGGAGFSGTGVTSVETGGEPYSGSNGRRSDCPVDATFTANGGRSNQTEYGCYVCFHALNSSSGVMWWS